MTVYNLELLNLNIINKKRVVQKTTLFSYLYFHLKPYADSYFPLQHLHI